MEIIWWDSPYPKIAGRKGNSERARGISMTLFSHASCPSFSHQLWPPKSQRQMPKVNQWSNPQEIQRAVSRFHQTKGVMKEKCCLELRSEKQEGREWSCGSEFSGFTPAASSSFHLHNGDGGITNSGAQPNLCCLLRAGFFSFLFTERKMGITILLHVITIKMYSRLVSSTSRDSVSNTKGKLTILYLPTQALSDWW